MPPKGSTKRKESPVEEPRRSTRGGGHKAPEPKAVKPRSKKAKVDKEEATANGNSEEKKDETAAAPAAVEEEKKEEPAKNGDASSELKETAKHNEAEVEKADSKRIEVGEQVPEGIILKNQEDKDVTIADITKEKGAVFFVYPKANTPGCTKQACLFRDAFSEFEPLGYSVYGLSSDSPTSQANWKKKEKLPFDLLCDPDQVLLKALGAAKPGKAKSNQRSHYIVEKGGKLVDAKYSISPPESAKQALEFIKTQEKKE